MRTPARSNYPCDALTAWSQIVFPEPPGPDSSDELVEVTLADGAVRRLRIQDYAAVFALPGLYEEVV